MSCEGTEFNVPMSPGEEEKINAIAGYYKQILELLGEDISREGLVKTPLRAAKALWFATGGYRQNPDEILRQAIFTHEGSQMVVVRDIEFYSFCEHHILPFFGTVSIGYIPDGEIIGLSKLPRLVNAVARKLQVQERLTAEICRDIERSLANRGVIVHCRAQHLCMQMRGVEKQLTSTATIHYSGEFESNPDLRREFFTLIST